MYNPPKVFSGSVGQATLVTGLIPPSNLASYFLYLPAQSPAWWHYLIGVSTLRDIPGIEPALRKYPEAEYELLAVALDPRFKPVAGSPERFHFLTPFNYGSQFHGVTDEQAQQVCVKMATKLVAGELFAEPQGIRGAMDLWEQVLKITVRTVSQ